MSAKTLNTPEVTDLLTKASGLEHGGGDERTKQIMHRLLHDVFQIIEDFDVTPEEFWHAANYLNELGANGEATLLAPGLGLDRFLDIRADARDAEAGLAGGTPRAIEGPLYVAGAPISTGTARMDNGTDEDAEVMVLTGQVRDDQGRPLADAVVDIWHADSKGGYSYFDSSQSEYNLRRRIRTDTDGRYTARSIVPSGYGCPPEGSTQKLLDRLGRHGNRPAHIHFFISRPGYRHLTTQINLADDEYLHDDFAFATRDELILEAKSVEASARARELGIDGPYREVVFDVALVATDRTDLQERHVRNRALEDEVA